MVFRQVHIVAVAVIFILALTVSGGIYTRNFLHDNPEEITSRVVNNQLELMKSGDIVDAYRLVSTKFRYETTYGEFLHFTESNDIFRNYIESKIVTNDVDSDADTIKAELTGRDKEITKLEYQLAIEDGAWKIMNITIQPPLPSPQSLDDKLSDELNVSAPSLSGFYDNTQSRYSINFPGKWSHEYMDNGTLILTGMIGSRSDYSSINIQTILTRKSGGRFKSVKSVVDDIKKQVSVLTKNAIFLESGPITLDEKSGAKAEGEYLVFSYSYDNNAYQQWDVIVSRNDGQVFYVWAYTSPINRYTDNLPVAKAILTSWKIY